MGTKRKNVESVSAKSGGRLRLRSIPKRVDSQYLDLYMLQKEKERLSEYKVTLERSGRKLKVKVAEIDRRIAEVEALMRKAAETAQEKLSEEKNRDKPLQPKNTLIIEY